VPDQVTIEVAPPSTTVATTDQRIAATTSDSGTSVSVVSESVAASLGSGVSLSVSTATGGGGGGTGTVDASGLWGLVQDTGAEFRADDIETALTHAQRAAIGTAWPDGNIGFATVGGTVYGWGPEGVSGLPVRVTYDMAAGTFSNATACTVDVGGSGDTYLAGGPVLYSAGRYVMFAHGEPSFDGHVLTSTDGLAWSFVGTLGADFDFLSVGCYVHPTDGYVYAYPSATGGTICIRVDFSDLFTWAAGGAPATCYRWTGSAWSSVSGSGVVLVGPALARPAVSDCCYVPQIDKVLAMGHTVHTGNANYRLFGWVVDPDTPYQLADYHELYRSSADYFTAADHPSNIGYAALVAPDRELDSADDYIDVLRVDALSASPAQPWDDTVVTRVRLRPAVRADDMDAPEMIDAVGLVTGTTGTTIIGRMPNGDQVTINLLGGDDVLALDTSNLAAGWQRWFVTDTGDWTPHPRQPQAGDRFQFIQSLDDSGVEYLNEVGLKGTGQSDLEVVDASFHLRNALAHSNVFLFNSSGTTNGGNVFTSWAALSDAVASVYGPKTIVFEQDETMPAGTYDWDDCDFRGSLVPWTSASGSVTLTLDDGVTFSSWRNGLVSGALRIHSVSTTPIVTIGDGEFLSIKVVDGSTLSCSSSASMFSVVDQGAGSGVCVVSLANDGWLYTANPAVGSDNPADFSPVITMSGAVCVVNGLYGNALVDGEYIGGAGIHGLIWATPTTAGAVAPTLTGFTNYFDLSGLLGSPKSRSELIRTPGGGTYTTGTTAQANIDELDAAVAAIDATIPYTPAVSGNWTTQPTTVAEALDMIAAWANPVP
jgi:hypothetical protein